MKRHNLWCLPPWPAVFYRLPEASLSLVGFIDALNTIRLCKRLPFTSLPEAFHHIKKALTIIRVATRAYESLKNVLANLSVVLQNLQAQQNFHWPWPIGRVLS